jgi:hypothetical protein
VEVTLHLVDEGFLIRLCLERSRHPQDFTITGALRVKGGVAAVAASEGPGIGAGGENSLFCAKYRKEQARAGKNFL